MYRSLCISKELLDMMASMFSQSSQEEGFLLGSSLLINQITHIASLPASHAGQHYYVPDAPQATEIIRHWSSQGICFCGFIHSHVTETHDLSEADLQFAETLFRVYEMPLLWFGLAVVTASNVAFHFYSITKRNRNILISPVKFDQKPNLELGGYV